MMADICVPTSVCIEPMAVPSPETASCMAVCRFWPIVWISVWTWEPALVIAAPAWVRFWAYVVPQLVSGAEMDPPPTSMPDCMAFDMD